MRETTIKNKIINNDSFKIDWRLATVIYHFLHNNIYGLPNYDYIEQITKDVSQDQSVISIGCGITVRKDLKIEIDDSMSVEDGARRDVIDETGHTAYMIKKNETNGTYSVDYIDTDKEPNFDKERIEKLINYLDMYHTIHQQKEKQKVKC